MKKEDMYNAISEVNSDILEKADAYIATKKAPKTIRWKRWIAAVACFCLLVVGLFSFFQGKKSVSPFVITAYAADTSENAIAMEMSENQPIPVSLFETNSGINGFVFSWDEKTDSETAIITIIYVDSAFSDNPSFEEIFGLKVETGKHYLYFIPDASVEEPYHAMFHISDQENQTVSRYDILIDNTNEKYTAVLTTITSFEIKKDNVFSANSLSKAEDTNVISNGDIEYEKGRDLICENIEVLDNGMISFTSSFPVLVNGNDKK